ncbi:MAG: hypothetical protein K0R29_120 [Pseudobdellovibrio sp.]|jgi:hypothetical protein|nr:hypothetical protein [Pseudobdellovibrio sp.]
MLSRKGQALIEALAGLLVSVLFFTSCLKLWAIAVTELKNEQQERQLELCNLSGSANCKKEGGFVFISLLMQLTVLLFATHVLIAIFLTEDFKWKITNWCFESSLALLNGAQLEPASSVSDIEDEFNLAAPQLISVKANLQGPFHNQDNPGAVSETTFRIGWVTTTHFNRLFQNQSEFSSQLKCGARKICENKRCSFSVIADKS